METTHLGFPPLTIAVFVGLAIVALAIDLVTHKGDKPITLLNASLWSIFWVAISMAFAGFLYVEHGSQVASLFITGYALEKVLSVDNLFVFMAIFSWFAVPDNLRHRVLYWGIIGAIIFRLIFVVIGTGLFAATLIVAGANVVGLAMGARWVSDYGDWFNLIEAGFPGLPHIHRGGV